MMAYFFCIGWATLFVFLAERQFKRVPIGKYKKKPLGRLLKRKEAHEMHPIIEKPIQTAEPEVLEHANLGAGEVKHINVILDGNDEIAILTPNITIKNSTPKQEENKKIQDIQRVRSNIIENNFPLNNGPASMKRRLVRKHGVKIELPNNKKGNENNDRGITKITEPTTSAPKRKIDSKMIVDIMTARKQKNREKNVEKVMPKKEEIPSRLVDMAKRTDNKKTLRNKPHIVGDEIFREKKINNIVKNAQKQKNNKRGKNIDGISKHRKVRKVEPPEIQKDEAGE